MTEFKESYYKENMFKNVVFLVKMKKSRTQVFVVKNFS